MGLEAKTVVSKLTSLPQDSSPFNASFPLKVIAGMWMHTDPRIGCWDSTTDIAQ